MAFPAIPTVAAGRVLTVNQADTSGTRTFPNLSSLTKNSGDLLIAIIVGYTSGVTTPFSTWGAGFTEFYDNCAASLMAVGMAYKWSTGSETGTFTVTQSTPTGHASMILLSISGSDGVTAPEAGSRADGTSAAANPAAFDPAGWAAEDTLWIAVRGSGETSTTGSFTGLSTPPANYTDSAQTGISGDVVGGTEGGVSFRQLNAASEDVGAGTCDTSNARNTAVVIAVRPSAETNLVIADAAHIHTADNLALTQVHELAVQDAAHAHTADNIVLTQVHELVVQDAAHVHTADNLTLTTGGEVTLVIADAAHVHTADNLALTVEHNLVVQDALHTHAADVLTLTQIHNLVVQDGTHSHTADNLTLTTAPPGGGSVTKEDIKIYMQAIADNFVDVRWVDRGALKDEIDAW